MSRHDEVRLHTDLLLNVMADRIFDGFFRHSYFDLESMPSPTRKLRFCWIERLRPVAQPCRGVEHALWLALSSSNH